MTTESSESAARKIASAVSSLANEDPEIKQMMRELMKDAIIDMRHTIKFGDGPSKAALQRLLLPHMAATATASAGQDDVRQTVAGLHAATLDAVLHGPDDDDAPRRVIPTTDEA